ncbi:hypothetical protein E1B28_007075 [Marasmius oreades]|uniref:Uncharacterized protein n=1 Tax=Marasmius oreades TaxID=181124 RepID=A0A9P7UVI8_9AGAR|nr:uncharacterized protein E1B28_007075 [Marasmius oreades]KAG7093394.1 hypothetical protein E1B28_007075 [Marasmius oreades]
MSQCVNACALRIAAIGIYTVVVCQVLLAHFILFLHHFWFLFSAFSQLFLTCSSFFMRLLCFLINVDALQPPAKRRRGLAGSIVSTALSAALIGTAVGLTVYRLWRDRGKAEPLAMTYEQPPPPPYSEAESRSRSLEKTSLPNAPPGLNVIPPTPVRRIHPHKPQRSTPRRRRVKAANLGFTSPSSNAVFPKPKAEFDFSFQSTSQSSSTSKQLANEVEVEDQMDWIGDKLSMLIEEGKRALGREVVVSSECAADEVDDGSGGWVEEHEDGGRGKSRSSSPRRVRRKESQRRLGIRHSPTSSHSGSLPSSPPFSSSTFPASQAMAYGSLGSTAVGSGSACESPEIRESMERARRKAMEARAARAAGAPFS